MSPSKRSVTPAPMKIPSASEKRASRTARMKNGTATRRRNVSWFASVQFPTRILSSPDPMRTDAYTTRFDSAGTGHLCSVRAGVRPGGEGAISEKDVTPMTIDDLLRFMVKQEASDLHLKPMRPPLVRISGKLLPLKTDVLHPDPLRDMLNGLLNDKMRATLDEKYSVDFGYSVAGVSRFRASVFHQRGTLSGVFRRVPFDFPSLEDWAMPPVLVEFAKLGQGLVVITGPTGSGKSSTLAALMRLIATTRLVHIVTIEDPIEFLLKDGLGAITQREVGTDTPGFAEALRNAMRQDPDVIMVGEM